MINPPSTTMHTIAWRLQSIAAPSLTTASYAARAQVILFRSDFSGLQRGQREHLTETKVVLVPHKIKCLRITEVLCLCVCDEVLFSFFFHDGAQIVFVACFDKYIYGLIYHCRACFSGVSSVCQWSGCLSHNQALQHQWLRKCWSLHHWPCTGNAHLFFMLFKYRT